MAINKVNEQKNRKLKKNCSVMTVDVYRTLTNLEKGILRAKNMKW